ncbi:hypothetical protein GGF32_006761 [Allomyces javanicus]|nr:hypothetical protein GGF32_006761 [Allomyces javanicus]
MTDAPAPPPAHLGATSATAVPQPPAPVVPRDTQLQALIAVSNEHNTATRAHLVARATATVESMRRMLEDLHTLAVLAKDTATVVPGLHDLAVVLRAMDTQGIRNQVAESRAGAAATPAHVSPMQLTPSRKRPRDDEVLDHAEDDGDDKGKSGLPGLALWK